MHPKITVCIPAYNNEKHIRAAIASALVQKYPLKEILVCDDCSSDSTARIASEYVYERTGQGRVLINKENLGIGKNLEKLMKEAKGKYVVYLCADDVFTNPNVLNDIVSIFDKNNPIGVIGRYYYYFMDGHEGAIGTCREKNILISSCCPSGMAFRKMDVVGTNKIFIEMPSIVAQYIGQYRWTMIEYDTVAARFHPGGNTGTKKSYYTESPTQNWIDFLGQNYQDFSMFIQLKNRAPKLLWKEICLHIKMDKSVFWDAGFWLNAIVAVTFPSFLLRKLTILYRNHVSRKYAQIIERPIGG